MQRIYKLSNPIFLETFMFNLLKRADVSSGTYNMVFNNNYTVTRQGYTLAKVHVQDVNGNHYHFDITENHMDEGEVPLLTFYFTLPSNAPDFVLKDQEYMIQT